MRTSVQNPPVYVSSAVSYSTAVRHIIRPALLIIVFALRFLVYREVGTRRGGKQTGPYIFLSSERRSLRGIGRKCQCV